jgi:hypothetical protein
MDTYPQLFWLKKEKEKTNGRKHTVFPEEVLTRGNAL